MSFNTWFASGCAIGIVNRRPCCLSTAPPFLGSWGFFISGSRSIFPFPCIVDGALALDKNVERTLFICVRLSRFWLLELEGAGLHLTIRLVLVFVWDYTDR